MTSRLEWDADTDSAQRAARVIALRALDSVIDARDGIRKRDPESVHQFRVALRRLRSWIYMYGPSLHDTLHKRTLRRLRVIADATTELRDLDVQIEWLRAERKALGKARLGAAKWILNRLNADRQRAWRKFRKVLIADFAKTERSLRRELNQYVVTHDLRSEDPVDEMRAITAHLMHEQGKALAVALQRIRSVDDTNRLHRARIIAKRTRYALQPLAAHAPGLTSIADDLTRFQDVVGELRDAQLLAHRVTRELSYVTAERAALVASEHVYRPAGAMDFSRIVTEFPFDASLSLLFARLRDRISAASRAASAALDPAVGQRLVSLIEAIA